MSEIAKVKRGLGTLGKKTEESKQASFKTLKATTEILENQARLTNIILEGFKTQEGKSLAQLPLFRSELPVIASQVATGSLNKITHDQAI